MGGMSQNPGQSTPSPVAAVLDGIAAGLRQLAGSVRRSFIDQRSSAEIRAYEEGWDAGICSKFSAECPYVREEQAEQWHQGFQAGWAQAW